MAYVQIVSLLGFIAAAVRSCPVHLPQSPANGIPR